MALYFLVYRLKHAQHMYYHTCNDRGNAFDSCTIALNSSRIREKQLLQYFFKILDNLTIVLKVRYCFLKQTKNITNKRSKNTKTLKEKSKNKHRMLKKLLDKTWLRILCFFCVNEWVDLQPCSICFRVKLVEILGNWVWFWPIFLMASAALNMSFLVLCHDFWRPFVSLSQLSCHCLLSLSWVMCVWFLDVPNYTLQESFWALNAFPENRTPNSQNRCQQGYLNLVGTIPIGLGKFCWSCPTRSGEALVPLASKLVTRATKQSWCGRLEWSEWHAMTPAAIPL